MLLAAGRIKMSYISLIKKHPKGMKERLPHFDKWVQTWKEPNISTYHAYYENLETSKQAAFMPDCPKSKAALDQVEFNFRPVLAQMHRKVIPVRDYFVDDHQLSQDIKGMTLKTFFEGVTKKQTRTNLQNLVIWSVFTSVLGALFIWAFLVNADDEPQVVQLGAHESFYHYQAAHIKTYIEMCIQKIDFLEKHSREELAKAKQRAELRQKNASK